MIEYKVTWETSHSVGEDYEYFETESEAYEAFVTLKEDFRDDESFTAKVEYINKNLIHLYFHGEDDDE